MDLPVAIVESLHRRIESVTVSVLRTLMYRKLSSYALHRRELQSQSNHSVVLRSAQAPWYARVRVEFRGILIRIEIQHRADLLKPRKLVSSAPERRL